MSTVDTIAGKKWGCYIKLHRLPFFAADSQLVYRWDNYKFAQYMKWKWYFRYRAALLQIKHPKQAVEIVDFNWTISDKEIEKIAFKNKLTKAKADLTKWENKLNEFIANWNLLFPYTDDPSYKSTLVRIEEQKNKLQELEAINERLNTTINS